MRYPRENPFLSTNNTKKHEENLKILDIKTKKKLLIFFAYFAPTSDRCSVAVFAIQDGFRGYGFFAVESLIDSSLSH